jgi:hypothetical protein
LVAATGCRDNIRRMPPVSGIGKGDDEIVAPSAPGVSAFTIIRISTSVKVARPSGSVRAVFSIGSP